MYSSDAKVDFQKPLLQSSVSHDQKSFKYADLVLKKHFLLLSMLKTVVLLNIYVEKYYYSFTFLKRTSAAHFPHVDMIL